MPPEGRGRLRTASGVSTLPVKKSVGEPMLLLGVRLPAILAPAGRASRGASRQATRLSGSHVRTSCGWPWSSVYRAVASRSLIYVKEPEPHRISTAFPAARSPCCFGVRASAWKDPQGLQEGSERAA